MKLTNRQHLRIMDEYDRIRRENRYTEEERRDEVYQAVPAIRQIDEKIASRTVERTRKLLFLEGAAAAAQELACREEIRDLAMERTDLLVRSGYPADYLDPIYVCPVCRDTGYVENDKCRCFKKRIRDLLIAQSNLADIRKDANFRNFRTDLYASVPGPGDKESPRDNIRRVLDTADRFIANVRQGKASNLLIRGKTGVGKSFLSSCIGSELLDAGKSVLYLTAYQLFDRLANYTFRRSEDNEDDLSRILTCDQLIIDDLGTELTNNFVNSRLFLCINERILQGRSTVINTNLSLEQISRTYSERVSSRIIESYTILYIFGEDIRIKKALSALDGKNDLMI